MFAFFCGVVPLYWLRGCCAPHKQEGQHVCMGVNHLLWFLLLYSSPSVCRQNNRKNVCAARGILFYSPPFVCGQNNGNNVCAAWGKGYYSQLRSIVSVRGTTTGLEPFTSFTRHHTTESPCGQTHHEHSRENSHRTLRVFPRSTFIRKGLESVDKGGWQPFDLTSYTGEFTTRISIVIKGTGSGAPGFKMLDARILGQPLDNPTDTLYVSGRGWVFRGVQLCFASAPAALRNGTGKNRTMKCTVSCWWWMVDGRPR